MKTQLQNSPESVVLGRVREEIERQLSGSGAPVEVHGFLRAHWARLMTTIFMVKGNQDPDWQAGWDTMNALLWSLSPKRGRKETAEMLRILPTLLARLQEGCIALGVPAREKDAFFESLSLLHAAVAREGLHFVTGEERIPFSSQDESLLAEHGLDLAKLPSATAEAPPPAQQPGEAGIWLENLAVGSRIIMRIGKEERSMVLNWFSPMKGMYLFTNEEGLEALTLTRARLADKFAQGDARMTDSPSA
ncbi:MAG: DUF1631 family protein [Pseudomonadota bacterium]